METRKFEIGKIRAGTWTADAVLSTEYPVRRFDGDEILSHEPDAVNLERAPLPLLVAHDNQRLPVGVVENLRIEGKSLKGVLRFSKNAADIWQDVTDGILRNLSVGYQILKRQTIKGGYIASRWMPLECSLVAAGADPMAGIGRNYQTIGVRTMDKNDVLKEKKRCLDEMMSLAALGEISSENKEKFDRLKDAVEGYDRKLEMMEDLSRIKKPEFKVPALEGSSREIRFEGGPGKDATFRSLFGEPAYDENEIRAFRASMQEGVPSGGGFSVPEPLSAKWLDDSLPEEIIRPRAQVWPLESSSRKIPGWDWSDMSSGAAFGGFTMAWTAELGTATAQTGKLRLITLEAKKGQVYCDISQELHDDGLGFDAQLDRALRKSISYGLEHAFIRGTGVGMPLGALNDPAKISVAKETGAAADSLCFESIVRIYARMYPAGRRKAVWICSETCLPQLMQLSVVTGVSGSWVNVFSEKDGNFTMMGRPVLFDGGHLPVLGDAGDILFCDLSQYAIGLRKDLRVERSPIPNWTTDQMSYRAIVRADGMGTWSSVFGPDNGDDLSWIVSLAERA